MVSPLLIFLALFVIFPTFYLWYLAFNKVTFINLRNPIFCGFKNFFEVFEPTLGFVRSVLFSFKFAFAATAVQLPLSLGYALLFNRNFRGKGLVLTLFLLPMFTSSALFGVVGRLLFNAQIGTATYLINALLRPFNIHILPLGKDFVFITLIFLDTVMWVPFLFLFIYTALRALPPDYIEAALIDGASNYIVFRHIILPYLTPLLGVLGVIRFADAFKTFDIIYTLTGGGPGSLTTSYSIKVYELAFVKGNFGVAAAASLLGFFILSIPLSFIIIYTRRAWRI